MFELGRTVRVLLASFAAVSFTLAASPARADEAAPAEVPEPAEKPAPSAPSETKLGGHLGVAVPYLQISKQTQLVGQNQFFTIATPVGISLHTSKKWTVDFEFIVTHSILKKETAGLIVDPGVVYHWGPVSTGLRVATQIGASPNIGLIPLVNKGFALPFGGKWFVEAAFPTFAQDGTVAFNAVLHTGLGF